jgi:TonB family protein
VKKEAGAAVLTLVAAFTSSPNGAISADENERLLDPCSAWDRTFPAPAGGAYRGPRKLHHVEPKFPREVTSPLWLGAVVLDTSGAVKAVHRVRPVTGDAALDEAVTKAVKQWRYEPYLVDGKPTEVCVAVSLQIHVR